MREVIQCLIDWLNTEPSDEKPHRIMRALANESLKKADFEETKRRFTAEEIVAATEGFPENADAKKWIDWNTSFLKYWAIRESQLIEFARQRSLQCYPQPDRYSPKGGPGNYATFFIKAVPLPELNNYENSALVQSSVEFGKLEVNYDLAANGEVKPSWLTKPLFRNGQVALKNWHMWMIMGWILFFGGIVIAFSYITWVVLSAPRPVTTQEVTLFVSIFVFPYVFWIYVARPWVYLLDDRIVIADAIFTSIREKPSQFEVLRDGDLRIIRLVRYSVACPICGATVYLEDGAPDYRRRLVGRCYESPREHVFSFDRVTRRGRSLIVH